MVVIDSIKEFFSNEPENRDASRIFHGRGRCFPGFEQMVIDYYYPVALIIVFADLYDEQMIQEITDTLSQQESVTTVVVQRRYELRAPSEVVVGALPENHVVTEQGLNYSVNLTRTQNSGLFLDMAEGRRWLRDHSDSKRVLNLFSFTCSLSVAALAGGASKVVNIDMAKGVLNTGRENHRLNDLDMDKVDFFAYDILKSWGRIKRKGPYDIVAVDPPSFQKGSFVATKDYRKVIRRLPELLDQGGIVMAALNSPELDSRFLLDLIAEEAPQLKFLQRLVNPESFPDIDPEASLKVLLFTLTNSC